MSHQKLASGYRKRFYPNNAHWSNRVGRKPQGRKAPVCYHCGITGHVKSDCWFLKRVKESQKAHRCVGFINSKKSGMAIEKPVLLPVETQVVPKPLSREVSRWCV